MARYFTAIWCGSQLTALRFDRILYPPPLNNLKLTLLLPNEIEAIEDLYAKVIDKPVEAEGCARIRFTGMLPEVTLALAKLRP